MTHRMILAAGLLLALCLPALAQKYPPDVQNALDLVRKKADDMGARGAGELHPVADKAVRKNFANHLFVVLRFRQFPVARQIPEGMQASNLFAVTKDGKAEHLKDVKTLEKFFRAQSPVVKTEADAKAALAAWLTLSPEYRQDGMFKFEVLEKDFGSDAKDDLVVRGRAMVSQGGNGEITAELTYDKEGKLAKAVERDAIRPGPRPICQATLLLDANPLVRRIAEQDLVIMGLSARGYLDEQRAKAAPELRREIDRVWRIIQRNGW
jgi:hypothetical protein